MNKKCPKNYNTHTKEETPPNTQQKMKLKQWGLLYQQVEMIKITKHEESNKQTNK